MKQAKTNHIISVDSETGIYWNGKQVLRRTGLIKSFIEKVTAQGKPESIASPFCCQADEPSRGKIGA